MYRIHNIPVTEAHARKGRRRSTVACPVALAIKANFEVNRISVGNPDGNWYGVLLGESHTFKLLGALRNQIKLFDGGGDFEPGIYQIEEVLDA